MGSHAQITQPGKLYFRDKTAYSSTKDLAAAAAAVQQRSAHIGLMKLCLADIDAPAGMLQTA